MNFKLLKAVNRNFAVKSFSAFFIIILITSIVFTSCFISRQAGSLKENMIKNGTLLSDLLAFNSRIGVFSENKDLLKDPVEGIFKQEGILEASVFNMEGTLLVKKQRQDIGAHERHAEADERIEDEIFKRIKREKSPFYMDAADRLEFWSPVISSAIPSVETMFFEDPLSQAKDRVIGFVNIKAGKKIMNKRLNALLFQGIIIGAFLLIIGSGITYLMVGRITRPLDRLTKSVKAFATGRSAERVPVETEDEIGRLAEAFNIMLDSLEKRAAEKQQLEEQLRHAHKMEAIGTLAGGVAHDFNNILTVILGYGNLLQMEIDEDSLFMERVENILASAHKAADLTKNLLAFSRKQMIDLRLINLNEDIRNATNLLSRLLIEDIELKLELNEEDLFVMADPVQLDQVLLNLAANARDAILKEGVVTIATEPVVLTQEFFKGEEYKKPGRYVLLSFADTGVGMDTETKEKIFDPFFTTKNVGKGTGLGLSMIYGIIKQHEGYINVKSEPGKGTTFKIYFPLIEAKDEKKETDALPTQDYDGAETILVAEDDESVRALIKETLEKAGYRIIAAKNGEDAISKFEENRDKIQGLLLDVVMPKINGKEVYEQISRIRPGIKTLFMSGYSTNILSKKGVIEEGINYIAKPISSKGLLKKVREIMD